MNKIDIMSIVAVVGIVCFFVGWGVKPLPPMPDYWIEIVARANYRAEQGEHWADYYQNLYTELNRESVSRKGYEKMSARAERFRVQRDNLQHDLEVVSKKLGVENDPH